VMVREKRDGYYRAAQPLWRDLARLNPVTLFRDGYLTAGTRTDGTLLRYSRALDRRSDGLGTPAIS
jgi:hypothetical protein